MARLVFERMCMDIFGFTKQNTRLIKKYLEIQEKIDIFYSDENGFETMGGKMTKFAGSSGIVSPITPLDKKNMKVISLSLISKSLENARDLTEIQLKIE